MLYMIILSAAGTVSELGYAVEGAYGIPILLASGIPFKYASLGLSLSPIVGIVIQSFVGPASDQCKCRIGKRRPFILLFGLISVICCGTIPYYFYYKYLYYEYVIPACVLFCVMVFNLSIGTLLIPARAYMLDVIPQSQEDMANLLTSSGVGVFTTLGFGLGAVKWTALFGNEHSIEKQSEIVFGLTAGSLLIVVLITVFALKEKSTLVPSKSVSRRALFSSMHSVGNYGTEKSLTDVSGITGPNTINDDNLTDVSGITGPDTINDDNSIDDPKDFDQPSCCLDCKNPCVLLKDSLIQGVQFFYQMSHHMWILFLTFTMAFAAEFSFTYSFTIFVGTVVYKGDSNAPVGTEEYDRYSEGVRMGSLGFAIGCFASIFISLALGKFMKYITSKLLFLIIVALFTCCMSLLMYFHQVPAALVLGSILGPYMGICVAVPYGLVAVYVVSIR